MEKQLTIKSAPATGENLPAVFDAKALENFTERLYDEPLADEVKINAAAGNSKYLPISFVETKLDELFFGLWQTRNLTWQVVANEIVATIELGIFHPVARIWLWRTGGAAVLIQQKRDSDITDISAKIKNTLVKDFPHLKAECIKNAAKSFGPAFGRDLNRLLSDDYDPFSEAMEQRESAVEQIQKCRTVADLGKLWKDNTQWHRNEAALDAFLEAKKRLSNGSANGK